jgi:hypothetical protein
MLRVHLGLQPLGGELQLPWRVADTLGELLRPPARRPGRVPGIEFVGLDRGATLVGHGPCPYLGISTGLLHHPTAAGYGLTAASA